MPDESDFRTEARLFAMEFLLTKQLAWTLRDLPDDLFEALCRDYDREFSLLTFPGRDAAVSDHIASEARDDLSRLLRFVGTIRRSSRQREG